MRPALPHIIHSSAIQRDWNNRDFIETIQLNVLQITEFLNEFERATKTKLATVNEKMSKVRTRLAHPHSSFHVPLFGLSSCFDCVCAPLNTLHSWKGQSSTARPLLGHLCSRRRLGNGVALLRTVATDLPPEQS